MPKVAKASTSSRHGEQRPSRIPIHPTDPSHAIALGVEAEERGERAAYGHKALRNYQEASRLYSLAFHLDPNGDEAADAAYNAGRVLYLIGCSFVMIDGKAGVLEESVGFYRRAAAAAAATEVQGSSVPSGRFHTTSSTNNNSPSSPTPFMLDIASNLAAALQAWAEILSSEDQEDMQQQQRAQALIMAQEAYHLYDDIVRREQEIVLASQLGEEVAALQQRFDAGAQQEEVDSSEMDTDADGDGDVGPINATASGIQGDNSVASHYVSSLIVPASLLETYHALHDILLENLLPLASSPAEIEEISQRMQRLLVRADEFVQQCQAADDWGERSSGDGEWAQALSQISIDRTEGISAIAVAKVDFALKSQLGPSVVAEVIAELTAEIVSLAQSTSSALSACLDPAFRASLSTAASSLPESRRRDYHRMKVDEIMSLTEDSVTLAKTLLRLATATEVHGVDTQGAELRPMPLAWSLASKASQGYLLLLSLLDPTSPGGAAAVLGTRASANPTTLLRCQIYTSLCSLCLHRADQRYAISSAMTTKVSFTSRRTILDNGRIYGRRGLAEVGLSWVYEEDGGGVGARNASNPIRSTTMSTPLTNGGRGKILAANVDATLKDIPPGGWDAVETMGEALLTLVRSIWARSRLVAVVEDRQTQGLGQDQGQDQDPSHSLHSTTPARGQVQMQLQAEAETELRLLARSAESLSTYPGWTQALDSKRFVRSILDDTSEEKEKEEEQVSVSCEEEEFWEVWWRRRSR